MTETTYQTEKLLFDAGYMRGITAFQLLQTSELYGWHLFWFGDNECWICEATDFESGHFTKSSFSDESNPAEACAKAWLYVKSLNLKQ